MLPLNRALFECVCVCRNTRLTAVASSGLQIMSDPAGGASSTLCPWVKYLKDGNEWKIRSSGALLHPTSHPAPVPSPLTLGVSWALGTAVHLWRIPLFRVNPPLAFNGCFKAILLCLRSANGLGTHSILPHGVSKCVVRRQRAADCLSSFSSGLSLQHLSVSLLWEWSWTTWSPCWS